MVAPENDRTDIADIGSHIIASTKLLSTPPCTHFQNKLFNATTKRETDFKN